MFQDEAHFCRINACRRCLCKKPQRPLVKAMLTHECTYVYAAISPSDAALDSLVLPHVNTPCTQVFIDEVATRYRHENIVMVIDGAGWHKSRALRLPKNLHFLRLPPYSPELNPQEQVWAQLREQFFPNRVFDSIGALEDHLVMALHLIELEHDRWRRLTA